MELHLFCSQQHGISQELSFKVIVFVMNLFCCVFLNCCIFFFPILIFFFLISKCTEQVAHWVKEHIREEKRNSFSESFWKFVSFSVLVGFDWYIGSEYWNKPLAFYDEFPACHQTPIYVFFYVSSEKKKSKQKIDCFVCFECWNSYCKLQTTLQHWYNMLMELKNTEKIGGQCW